MLHVKNLKEGLPENEEQALVKRLYGVVLLFDEEGFYWYDTVKKFSPHTYKILYDSLGNILQIENDASYLSPSRGCSVLETEGDEARNLRDKIGSMAKEVVGWKVLNNNLVFSPNEQEMKLLKTNELNWVRGEFEIYKTREVLDLLSPEEKRYMDDLLNYARQVDECSSGSDLQSLLRPSLE